MKMSIINPKVDKYMLDGCMRCKLGATPKCKVNKWRLELETLRQIALESGLNEELKWGVPCYTINNKNILIVAAFNNYSSINFFKGSLLKDTHGILEKPGENSQSTRVARYTNIKDITKHESILKAYIKEAIALEKAGAKVDFKKNTDPFPEELIDKMNEDDVFKKAFYALTPGRQRGYILHFSAAKQSQTRATRIEKCIPKIMEGKGLNDY
ncbi:MAG: YdeI/OmpD-associated family protein [Bacteroidia bacterium]|nr:YdeI/OmpD-associated family protein [Bacteroidia bacterium]